MKTSNAAKKIQVKLKQKIIDKIAAHDGAICFSEFMQMALYTPKLGYYQNNLLKFGEQGDFITAPEMGDLFARGVAQSLFNRFQNISFNIMEYGAGSGALAADLLKVLQEKGCLPQRYFILEPSAVLQQQQYQQVYKSVPELADRVSWLESLPKGFEGVVIANEVLDAIPFELIQFHDNAWYYLGVNYQKSHFVWQLMGKVENALLPSVLRKKSGFVEGCKTEIRPMVKAWIHSLSASLNNGWILLFDYGYPQRELYHPQRKEGSLRCFSRHQSYSNPLVRVGLQDITAHVDFTDVAQAAVDVGLSVEGFTTQAGYLVENQILQQSQMEQEISRYHYSQQVQKLTAPGQMGEAVKVLLLSKNKCLMKNNRDFVITGFSFQDQLYRL